MPTNGRAIRESGGDAVEGTPVDVTDKVYGGRLTADIPAGVRRIRVNFLTAASGANPEHINCVERDSVRVVSTHTFSLKIDKALDKKTHPW